MNPLMLQPCRPADLRALATWFADEGEARSWGGASIRWPLSQMDLQDMRAEGEFVPPSRRCWSALAGDALVGHGQAAYDRAARRARLARIAIAPHRRGEGLGRALVGALLAELLADPSIRSIGLNVYAHNRRAIGLYRALGFVETHRHPVKLPGVGQNWINVAMEFAHAELDVVSQDLKQTQSTKFY